MFYSVYGSTFNKESIDTLRYSFSLDEFLRHQEFISFKEDLDAEAKLKSQEK